MDGLKEDGGYTVIVQNGEYSASYCHMDPNFIVKVGQIVSAGDIIAKISARFVKAPNSNNMITNGNTTGPHLHFGLRKNGTSVDPLPYITSTKT